MLPGIIIVIGFILVSQEWYFCSIFILSMDSAVGLYTILRLRACVHTSRTNKLLPQIVYVIHVCF